jgi:hypothetical protein
MLSDFAFCVRNAGLLTMPVGDVLVGDTRGHVEHDDTALAINVVSITETTEFLLSSGVPDIKLDLTQVLPQPLIYAQRCRKNCDRIPW